MPLLLEAAPGVSETWREHLEYWGSEDRGPYTDLGAFAGYLVQSFGSGSTSEFGAVFDVVEQILRDGDESAKQLATIGVLEDIQTIASHESFGAEAFVKWLGPLSREAWDQIDRLWRAGNGSLAGVLRVEGKLNPEETRHWWQFWKTRPRRGLTRR